MIGDGDLELIFANGDFDQTAVFTVTAGTVTVKGWFTEATEQVNIMTGQVEAVNPSFTTAAAGVATVKHRNTVVIDGVTYQVARVEKVGNGVALVHLQTT